MIYLDNSATTRPSKAAMAAAWAMMERFGNPSSLHGIGLDAFLAVDEARKAVAATLSARPDEIYFTSGGTESNNTALLCGAQARRKRGDKIVISAVEHDSVMVAASHLEEQGFRVVRVSPKADGTLEVEDFAAAVDEKTILVSCMMVNNETGALFPVDKLRGILTRAKAPALLHIDAVQALGKEKIDLRDLNCDMMTLSAHKIHGLKGCGALYLRKGVTLKPHQWGGHQEKGFRAGTENTVGIAAFGAACKELSPAADKAYLSRVKEAFLRELTAIPGVVINSPSHAAAHILNFSVPGYRSETLLHALEQREIFVSSGSACKKGELSHVLKAQGLPPALIDSAVRISLDRENTPEDAAVFARALREIMATVAHVPLQHR